MKHANAIQARIKPAMQYIPVAMVLLSRKGFVIEEINRAALDLLQTNRSVIGKRMQRSNSKIYRQFISSL